MVKIRDENVMQFKSIIQNLINLLTEVNTDNEIKKHATMILQKLVDFEGGKCYKGAGNFKLNESR